MIYQETTKFTRNTLRVNSFNTRRLHFNWDSRRKIPSKKEIFEKTYEILDD